MNSVAQLTVQAIDFATHTHWEEAREKNQAILDLEPQNIGALNRLAFCEMQLENYTAAKRIYESVLEIERFNPIATKYLSMLKHRVKPQRLQSSSAGEEFIEEPGKTKSVSLQKLADPEILQSTPMALQCNLVVKNHRVNVVSCTGTYLGSLPDDIAFRLQKLITAGNTYSVIVQSTSKKGCIVFIKEVVKAKNSPFATSFPLNIAGRANQIHEDVLLDEAPLDTRETGNEMEEPEPQAIEERDFME